MASLETFALTSVADVKESLGISSGDHSKDNLIIRKINQATMMIEAFCGKNNSQHFALTTYTAEEYDASGTNQLVLRNSPVVTFTSLSQRDTSQNVADFTVVDTQDYFIDLNSGIVEGIGFPGSYNRYTATYSAGFATIPSDLAEACVMLASALIENSSSGNAIKSKSQGPKSISYYDNSQTSSLIEQLGIDDMLQRYVRIPILPDK